jgi:UDP-N-acetylglucosamine 2-epimerase
MKRIEIVANKSIEENIVESFKQHQVSPFYTVIPVAHGEGKSGPRRGDHIWPEENVIFILYCSDEEADKAKESVRYLKERFPDEGIKVFAIQAEEN